MGPGCVQSQSTLCAGSVKIRWAAFDRQQSGFAAELSSEGVLPVHETPKVPVNSGVIGPETQLPACVPAFSDPGACRV
jgi:hypothetical protein